MFFYRGIFFRGGIFFFEKNPPAKKDLQFWMVKIGWG